MKKRLILVPMAALWVHFASPMAAASDSDEVAGGCADFNDLNNLYWGDIHIHSGFSHDAVGYGITRTPDDVYADAAGQLDIVAVTDHSEYLGEALLCITPGSPGYAEPICEALRSGDVSEIQSLCRADPPQLSASVCATAVDSAWTRTQQAAQAAYVPCEMTTFNAYEYTLGQRQSGQQISTGAYDTDPMEPEPEVGGDITAVRHRNVIFRGRAVSTPIKAYEVPSLAEFWQGLDEGCLIEDDCRLISIPHQINTSRGFAFSTLDFNGEPMSEATLALQAQLEPLVEIIQHKGASECYPGHGAADEDCAFEQLDSTRLLDAQGQVPALSFAREGLKAGLQVESTTGINPFRFGMVGSTDTHNAIAGATSESAWAGHAGSADGTLGKRLLQTDFGPGGLIGVWARENTRPEVFRSFLRKEVFATSGTRLAVRFFGGWDLAAGDCASPVNNGYAKGVPMGGQLPPGQTAPQPSFLAFASRDPASNGIRQLQIIKGWLNPDGSTGEAVHTVAMADQPGGAQQACIVWTDPSFNPLQPAFYYLRVMEAEVDRWHRYDCAAAAVNCADINSVPDRLMLCCDDSFPAQIRERAWSSPIWFSP